LCDSLICPYHKTNLTDLYIVAYSIYIKVLIIHTLYDAHDELSHLGQ